MTVFGANHALSPPAASPARSGGSRSRDGGTPASAPYRGSRDLSLRTAVALFAVSASGLPAEEASPDRDAPAPGRLVVAGGAISASQAEIWDWVYAEGLPGMPIGIISTASRDPAATGAPLAQRLNDERGERSAVFLPIGVDGVSTDNPELLEAIRRCGGFFFTGGQQSRSAARLIAAGGEDTAALAAIRERHLAGAVLAGSSAGAAIMSDPMISSGRSADALRHGATPPGGKGGRGVTYRQGFGFHPGTIYCQHHLERGRLGRLLVATLSEGFGQSRGIGVAEDSAVVVDLAKGTATAIGAGGAVYLDSTAATLAENGAISGVVLHYLERGDAVSLTDGGFRPAPGRSETTGAVPEVPGEPVLELPDAWAPDAIRRMIAALAESEGPAESIAWDGERALVLRRADATKVWRTTDGGENPARASVSGLELQLR